MSSAHLEAEARERQLATLKQNTVPQKIVERKEPTKNRDNESAVKAAKLLNTNKQYNQLFISSCYDL